MGSHCGQDGHDCRTCCRACLVTRCLRHGWWRRGLALLCVATSLSLLLPGAPLAHWFLSEDAERYRLLSENEIRLQRSQHFMELYKAERDRGNDYLTRHSSVTRDSSEVGITVLTMVRGRRMSKEARTQYRTQYLTQSVATLLNLLNDTSLRRSYSFHICNIDDEPDLFQEAKDLEDVIPVFKRYGATDSKGLGASTIWEKLKMDYVYCMRQTLAQGVRYALLVEDDAVAHHHLFHVLEHVLDRVVEAPRARPVAYIKLYHPKRLLGYISLEVERLSELLALSLVVGAFLTYWRSRHRGSIHHDLKDTSPKRVLVRWLGWAVVVAVLALAVGRTNLLELRRLSPHLYQVTPTPSCCIPAVLYTRPGAQDFSSYLTNVTCTSRRSTDIRMDEFRDDMGWRGLLVQPNLFSHIGLMSSLRTKEVSPLIVQ